jgi:hypothetical protein
MDEQLVSNGYFKGCTINDLHQIAAFHKMIKNYLKIKRIEERHGIYQLKKKIDR